LRQLFAPQPRGLESLPHLFKALEVRFDDLYAIARVIEDKHIEALLVIGGWSGYQSVHTLLNARPNFPAFNIPIICLPATINNNLPGSEFSIGADTALNSITEAVDKIKQSAVATRRSSPWGSA